MSVFERLGFRSRELRFGARALGFRCIPFVPSNMPGYFSVMFFFDIVYAFLDVQLQDKVNLGFRV